MARRELSAAATSGRFEEDAEAAALRELGVEFAQGHLYGRPAPLL